MIADDLAVVVDKLFDRFTDCLPVYVSRTPSILYSCIIALCLFTILSPIIYEKRKDGKQSKHKPGQLVWVFYAILLFLFCMIIQSILQKKIYAFHMIAENKQHFANTLWIQEYLVALRKGRLKEMT